MSTAYFVPLWRNISILLPFIKLKSYFSPDSNAPKQSVARVHRTPRVSQQGSTHHELRWPGPCSGTNRNWYCKPRHLVQVSLIALTEREGQREGGKYCESHAIFWSRLSDHILYLSKHVIMTVTEWQRCLKCWLVCTVTASLFSFQVNSLPIKLLFAIIWFSPIGIYFCQMTLGP